MCQYSPSNLGSNFDIVAQSLSLMELYSLGLTHGVSLNQISWECVQFILDLFLAMASSTAFNCLSSSSRRDTVLFFFTAAAADTAPAAAGALATFVGDVTGAGGFSTFFKGFSTKIKRKKLYHMMTLYLGVI